MEQSYFSESKKFQHFMEHGGSLPHTEKPAISPYPQPDQSCPYTPPLTEDPFWYPPIHSYIFQVVSFPQVSPLNPYNYLSCSPHMPRGHPSHSSLFDNPNNIWWGKQIILLLIMQYSPLLLPHPSWAQISSSAYILLQCDKPGFTPIRNQQAKLLFCIF